MLGKGDVEEMNRKGGPGFGKKQRPGGNAGVGKRHVEGGGRQGGKRHVDVEVDGPAGSAPVDVEVGREGGKGHVGVEVGRRRGAARDVEGGRQAWSDRDVEGQELKQTIKLTKDGNSFKISGVRRSHAGSYVCRVETSPAIEVTHTLDVQYPAKVRRVSQEVQQVIQGSSVTLECRADGNPPAAISWSRQHGHLTSGAQSEEAILHTGAGDEAKLVCIVHGRPSPTVTWTRGGHAINTDRHISSHDGLHRHALTVKDVKDDDFGDYTCTATSPLGRTNSSFRLTGQPFLARRRAPGIHFIPREHHGPAWRPVLRACTTGHALTHFKPPLFEGTVAVGEYIGCPVTPVFPFYPGGKGAAVQSASGGGALCVAPTLVAAVVVLALPLLS
ncbi:Protein amalgam [Chionoecetes opilio]|uniref:Protein amalgam n=1 Tax=Chionoecetes opilio TaxID=41210 RepID=A0A8J5CJM7_CHIOP|nr:Protein amalgam [Chionoecetes opilio]